MNNMLIIGLFVALLAINAFILLIHKYRSGEDQSKCEVARKEVDFSDWSLKTMRELPEGNIINQTEGKDCLRRKMAATRRQINCFIQESRQTSDEVYSLNKKVHLTSAKILELFDLTSAFTLYYKYLK